MTYSTFENRLNRYFDSTNSNNISSLTEITGGVVRPIMSRREKKVVYKLMKKRYPNIHADYTFSSLVKKDYPSVWTRLCNAIPQTEKIESNFYYAILFNDTNFYE